MVSPWALAQLTLERVEITGTSIKRILNEGVSPVTTLGRAEIERSGATNAQGVLGLMSSNLGGNSQASRGNSSPSPAAANLRSLGPRYTLVLLNGRRMASYSFDNAPVDLSAIPLAAIERVEVVRDGASAIYGDDAVAGVINFIMRKDYQGLELSAYANQAGKGGGETRSASVSAGYGDISTHRFNVFATLSREQTSTLWAADREFTKTGVRPDLGLKVTSLRTGVGNLSFTDTRGNVYGTGQAAHAPMVNPNRHLGCAATGMGMVPSHEPGQCHTDYVQFIDLTPQTRRDSLVARGVYQVSENQQLYSELTYTEAKIRSVYSPAPWSRGNVNYPSQGRFYPSQITLPKGLPLKAGYTLPDGSVLKQDTVLTQDLVVQPVGTVRALWRAVDGGGRTDLEDQRNARWVLGSKGAIGQWDYDLGFAAARHSTANSFGPGQYSYAALGPVIASGAINLFGPQDAQSLSALNATALRGRGNESSASSQEIDLRVSSELAEWEHGPFALALGASHRRETLSQHTQEVVSSGDLMGSAAATPDVVGKRRVSALFMETSVPLYTGLELQGAARYDHYNSGFGGHFHHVSPKLGLRFQPNKGLMVRASYATGFRSPTLFENLRPPQLGLTNGADYSDPIRCPGGQPIKDTINPVGTWHAECETDLLTQEMEGRKDLKPERSRQLTLGMVFQPSAQFNGAIDYWDILIKNAIRPRTEGQVMGDPTGQLASFYRYDPRDPANWCVAGDPSSADGACATRLLPGSTNKDYPLAYLWLPFANTARFLAAGLDINLNYRSKLPDGGALSVSFDGTYITRHGYQFTGQPQVSDLGRYQDHGAAPRWRHVLSVSLARGAWSGSLTHSLTSGYWDYTDRFAISKDYPAQRWVSAYPIIDAQVNWRGVKGLDVMVGIKNLNNQTPPATRNVQNRSIGYDPDFTDPLGRAVYLRLKYKFF